MELETIEERLCPKMLTGLLALYCVLLPFEEIFIFSFGSIQKILRLAMMALTALVYSRHWKEMKNLLPLILWMGFMILSVLWADSFAGWRHGVILYGINVAFLCLMELVPAGKIDRAWVRRSLILGGCVATATFLLFPEACGSIYPGRKSIILMGRTMDPNVEAILILLGVHGALAELFETKSLRMKVLFLLLAGFQTFGMLLTGSRGAVIALMGGVAVMVVLLWKNKENRKKIILFGLVAVGVILLMLVRTDLLERMSSVEKLLGINNYKAGEDNRWSIWLCAWELFLKQPVVGYGCGNFPYALETVRFWQASHNFIVLLAVEGGLVGLCLFAWFGLNLLKDLGKVENWEILPIVVSVLVMSLTLDALVFKFFWVALLLARLTIRETAGRSDKKIAAGES